MRFAAHHAFFVGGDRAHYFLNVVNLTDVPTTITHLWYEDEATYIPVEPPSRRLPKRLLPGEVWETWVPLDLLPEHRRGDAHADFQLRLANGEVYRSVRDDDVPPYGTVPGGPA